MILELPIADIRRDAELQPRARLDDRWLDTYEELMREGHRFHPVTVFCDDAGGYWLADGYHRVAARERIGATTVQAEILDGDRRDALTYSLSANAKHGKPREPGDFIRAYQIAVRNGLVQPDNAKQVQVRLGCTLRWAQELTKASREQLHEQRDAAVMEAMEPGKPLTEVAREVGISPTSVRRIVAREPKAKPAPERKTRERETPKKGQSGSTELWSQVLDVLRRVATLPSANDLFANWDGAVEDQVEREIGAARAWMVEVEERFEIERSRAA